MTDTTASSMPAASVHTTDEAHRRLKARYNAEWRFKTAGMLAILLATLALVSLLWTVFANALGALRETYVTLPVSLDREALNLPDGDLTPLQIRGGNFSGAIKTSLKQAVPTAKGRSDRRLLYSLASDGAETVGAAGRNGRPEPVRSQ